MGFFLLLACGQSDFNACEVASIDYSRFGGDHVAQGGGGVVAARTALIDVNFKDILGLIGGSC